jgi:DNA primase
MILAFDSDEAGARAAERAYPLLDAFPVEPRVLILPDGLDPADLVGQEGVAAFEEAASQAEPVVRYMIRRTVRGHELASAEGRTSAVAAALPIVEGLPNVAYLTEAAHFLADLTGAPHDAVMVMVEDRTRRSAAHEAPVKRASAQERVEREMLRLLARDTEIFATVSSRLSTDHFQTARNRDLFALLQKADGDVGSFVAHAQDEREVQSLSALALEPLDGEVSSTYAEDVWARLQEFALKRESAALRQTLQKLNPTTDPRYDELFQQLIAIDGELRRLRERGGAR